MSEQEKDARVEAVARFLWDDGNHGDWRKTSELARDGFRAQARAILGVADAAQTSAEGEAVAPWQRFTDLRANGASERHAFASACELAVANWARAAHRQGLFAHPAPAPAVPEGMRLVQDNTVYVLNAKGTNRWWASVQPGHDDNGNRISADECRAVANMLAAAPEAPAPAGWQPIETAPMDGTEVLVYVRGDSLFPTAAAYKSAAYFEKEYGDRNYMPEGWYWAFGYPSEFHEDPIEPTHWMPLPAAPEPTHD